MNYRTRTYIAADWDSDSDAVEQLHKWNDSNYWSLSFSDAHDLKQAKDSSLNCSIKASLRNRLEASKTFILIVGTNTKTVKAGSCQYCPRYNSIWQYCTTQTNSVDFRSYIEFECEKAVKDGLKIIVLYKSCTVDKSRCPNAVKYLGTHIPMWYRLNGSTYWDYQGVKKAIES